MNQKAKHGAQKTTKSRPADQTNQAPRRHPKRATRLKRRRFGWGIVPKTEQTKRALRNPERTTSQKTEIRSVVQSKNEARINVFEVDSLFDRTRSDLDSRFPVTYEIIIFKRLWESLTIPGQTVGPGISQPALSFISHGQ